MKDIAIYGVGGLGREVACMINSINELEPTWNLIGFFDDNPNLKGKMISHLGVCHGGMTELNEYSTKLALAISISNPEALKTICSRINNVNIYFPNIIRPDFRVADMESFVIGKGNIIQSNCIASCDVTIGDFNVFNGSVVMGHDVKIGSYNTFMPAVRISGEVTVGNENFFGVGSIVLQQIKIGNNIRLGAGSVLMTKPKDGYLYMGNPARKTEF